LRCWAAERLKPSRSRYHINVNQAAEEQGIRMSKYDPLNKWLSGKAAAGVSTVATTFQHIETVLGFELPSTARKKAQWWGNEAVDTAHVQCQSWLNAGFEVKNLNLSKETITFAKV